jgi:hypothetical protein
VVAAGPLDRFVTLATLVALVALGGANGFGGEPRAR